MAERESIIDRLMGILRDYPIIPIFLVTWLLTQNLFIAGALGIIAQLLFG